MTMSLADRLTAIVLAALGLSMAVGGYTMDRLAIRQIHPASIPGLVPMILGTLMIVCAALLWREARAGTNTSRTFHDGSWMRLAATAGLCLVYALILVGWLPFFWSTALFVTAFAAIFSWPETGGRAACLRALAIAVAVGAAVTVGTSLLFAEVFLVRLP